jgi:hypothetical protein
MRFGKSFGLGTPYISVGENGRDGGICYFWPNPKEDYEQIFSKHKEKLSPFLLEKIDKYMDELELKRFKHGYPYVQKGMKGLAYHIDGDGRWIEITPQMSNGMSAFHNIDSYLQQIAGFNLTSDALEFMDKEIDAPRIIKKDSKFVIRYPLPKGKNILPLDKYPIMKDAEHLQRLYNATNNGKQMQIDYQPNYQTIKTETGIIHVENGIMEGHDFERFNINRATFLMSVLLRACKE